MKLETRTVVARTYGLTWFECNKAISLVKGEQYFTVTDVSIGQFIAACWSCAKIINNQSAGLSPLKGKISLSSGLIEVGTKKEDLERSPLEKALEIVKEKRSVYGDPTPNHKRIAALWSAFLETRESGEEKVGVLPGEVALMMILLKIARLMETPDHEDSIIDIAGYIDCYNEIMKER